MRSYTCVTHAHIRTNTCMYVCVYVCIKVLNIRYRDRIGWGFFILDIGYRGRYRRRAYWVFILDTIYNEILITKSWFSVIDIIYLIKMM